jgi:hypothetical protein
MPLLNFLNSKNKNFYQILLVLVGLVFSSGVDAQTNVYELME